MKTKDMFHVALRLLGLVFLYHGLVMVPTAIAQFLGGFPHQIAPLVRQSMSVGSLFFAVVMIGWPLLVAYWLMRGAPYIMDIAFPEAESDREKIAGEV